MGGYFTEDVIAGAKRSEFFPISQATFTDPDDFVAFANEEIAMKLVPLLMSARQDYFEAYRLVPIKNNLDHYALPERAIGDALKEIKYLPNGYISGTTTIDYARLSIRYPLSKVSAHESDSFALSGGQPSGFYMRGSEVVLVPVPGNLSGTEALMMWYFMRPSMLTPTTNCAKITGSSVVGATTVYTVNTDLTASSIPLVVGSKVDFQSATSPFKPWAIDVVVQGIASTTITVNTVDIQDESATSMPQVGDYICPAQYTCIVMLPQDLHPIVGELVCCRALKALGLTDKLNACAQNVRDSMQGIMKLVENRIEDEPDVLYDPQGFAAMTNSFGYLGMTTR